MRLGLLEESRFGKYLLYASGEIVLVIIGILVALYLNDLSDAHKERARELAYLRNIQSDLRLNIAEADKFLAARTGNIEAAKRILEHFDGKPVADYSAFNRDAIGIYSWRRFYLANNTFQELINSGNLGAISNTGIKHQLLDIEALYLQMKSEEDHFRYDTEKLIYEPLYRLMDLESIVDEYAFRVSGGKAGRDVQLTPTQFEAYFKSVELKNGFVMTVLEFDTMNGQMRELRAKCQALIARIDEEVKSGG
jgi:hypothetical protein